MPEWTLDRLGELILAAGGLGIAAFGIVEGLKWSRLGVAGFGPGMRLLGQLTEALAVAYGPDWSEFLKAQYRQGRVSGELPRTIRQGVRAGLRRESAEEIAEQLGFPEPGKLGEVAEKLTQGKKLTKDESTLLGRFELAADARIDAALGLSDSRYVVAQRVAAGFWALFIALAVAFFVGRNEPETWGLAFLVGLTAVPLAPISKDVVNALQAAEQALRARR